MLVHRRCGSFRRSILQMKNAPAVQKCRTCVQPYRGSRYTGTHVRLFSLARCFSRQFQRIHGHSPFALSRACRPASIYGGNADRLQNWAILQFEREEGSENCKNARDRTTSVWNFRGGEIAGKSVFYIPLFRKRTPFLRKGIAALRNLSHKKSRPETVLSRGTVSGRLSLAERRQHRGR